MRPVSPTKELRDAFNIRGIPGADATDPRHPVHLSFTRSLNFTMPENTSPVHFSQILVSASANSGGTLTAQLVGEPTIPGHTLTPVDRFHLGTPIGGTTHGWAIPFFYSHQGGENHEANPQYEFDIELNLTGNTTYQPAVAHGLITITITDTSETIRAGSQPAEIVLHSQDPTIQHIDMSSAYSDQDESGWNLSVSPLSSPAGLWRITNFDAAAHTFDIAATGTEPTTNFVAETLTVLGTDGSTGATSASPSGGWKPVVKTWRGGRRQTLTIGRSDTTAANVDYSYASRTNLVQLVLPPTLDGSSTPINLGTYLAAVSSEQGITTGAITFEIDGMTLNGEASDHYLSSLTYTLATGLLTADWQPLPAGDELRFTLRLSAAAVNPDTPTGALAAQAELNFAVISQHVPTLAISVSNRHPIAEGYDGETTPLAVADITAEITGLPADLDAKQRPTLHLSLADAAHSKGGNSHLFSLDNTAIANGARVQFVGSPRDRADGTSIVASVLVRAAGTEEVADTQQYEDITIPILPAVPTWPASQYYYTITDGEQPPIPLDTLAAIKSKPEYGLIYRINENTGDPQRLVGITTPAGAVSYDGPAVPSRAASSAYAVQAQARQSAANGDLSEWSEPATLNIAVDAADNPNNNEVQRNTAWMPAGGLVRTIQLGPTHGFTLEHVDNAWLVPSGAEVHWSASLTSGGRTILNFTEQSDSAAQLVHVWGLSAGEADLTLGGTVLYEDATSEALPVIEVEVTVLAEAPTASSFAFYRRTGSAGSYVYTQISSLTGNIDEGASAANLFADNPIYFTCTEITNRLLQGSVSHDPDDVWTLDYTHIAQILTPPQTARRLDLTADGAALDHETITRYTAHLLITSPATTISGTTYDSIHADLPIVLTIGDVDEGPVFDSDYNPAGVIAFVHGLASPFALTNRWHDPEGRTLSYQIRSTNDAIVSFTLINGNEALPQYNSAGTANLEGRAFDGTIWSPWETLENYDIRAQALAAVSFVWAAPPAAVAGNAVVKQLWEDDAVGTDIITGLYATASTDDQTATVGSITYGLESFGDGIIPPASAELAGADSFWWQEDPGTLWTMGSHADPAGSTGPQHLNGYSRLGHRIDGTKSVSWQRIGDIYAGGSTVGYGVGKTSQAASWQLAILSGLGIATIAIDNTITLSGTPHSVEAWGDGSSQRVRTAIGRVLQAFTATGGTLARASADDWTIPLSLADSIQAFGSNDSHVWIACLKGSVKTLRCWNKTNQNRVEEYDIALSMSGTVSSVEVVDSWILVMAASGATITGYVYRRPGT